MDDEKNGSGSVSATVDNLIAQIRRCPGLTLDPQILDETVKQTDFTIPELHAYIAKMSETDLEFNEYGSPRFMPRDAEEVKEIRELWDRCGLDSKAYGPGGKQ
jgi:hypothetical protein